MRIPTLEHAKCLDLGWTIAHWICSLSLQHVMYFIDIFISLSLSLAAGVGNSSPALYLLSPIEPSIERGLSRGRRALSGDSQRRAGRGGGHRRVWESDSVRTGQCENGVVVAEHIPRVCPAILPAICTALQLTFESMSKLRDIVLC